MKRIGRKNATRYQTVELVAKAVGGRRGRQREIGLHGQPSFVSEGGGDKPGSANRSSAALLIAASLNVMNKTFPGDPTVVMSSTSRQSLNWMTDPYFNSNSRTSGRLIFTTAVSRPHFRPAALTVARLAGATLDVVGKLGFGAVFRVDRGSATDVCPVDIGAQVFASDGAGGGALNGRAFIGRDIASH